MIKVRSVNYKELQEYDIINFTYRGKRYENVEVQRDSEIIDGHIVEWDFLYVDVDGMNMLHIGDEEMVDIQLHTDE